MAVAVGTFAKTTGAATVAQAITGVGFSPKALILWTGGATATGSWQDSIHFGYGYAAVNAAKTITVGSIAFADQDAQDTSNTGMRVAAKALTIIEYDGSTVLAECDLTSFDADGFTLSWTTNDATAYVIHYMALAGVDLTDAYVKSWTFATSTGNQAITGVGFQPDCVLHIGATLANALPQSGAGTQVFLGGMTSGTQFAIPLLDRDAQATTSTRTSGDPTLTIAGYTTAALADYYAAYVSLDADGFTVSVGNAAAANINILSLCLKGGSYNLGTFYTPADATPVDDVITGVGFQPEGVLLLANGINASFPSGAVDITLGIGAMDGTGQNAVHLSSENGAGTSNSAIFDSADKSLLYDANGDQSISVQAGYKAFGADGFTVTIDTGDAGSSQDVFYFAFAGGDAERNIIPQWQGVPGMQYSNKGGW